MHDISLGHTVADYLTGEQVEATTYEDLRQALARLFVEELGYPRERLSPRHEVTFPVQEGRYCRIADLAAFDEQRRPLFLLFFASGEVSTYEREVLAAARLVQDGPAPLVAVTDSKDAALLETARGQRLGRGMRALPHWDRLQELAAEHPAAPLSEERAERERRILFSYTEGLYGCCSHAACTIESKGGRWQS